MGIIDKAVINRYHEIHVRDHGEGTVRALGWRHSEDQLVRFAMLAGIGNMNNCSVLDAGCGHGDLRAYLGDKYPRLRYIGIDQSEAFLSIASDRYTHLPETTFYLGDFSIAELPVADYVLVSGSLNYHNSDPGFIYKIIDKLFNTSRIALGFNLLSKVDAPDGILVSYDADDIVQYCRTLSDKVLLYDTYFEGDFTIWMYR
jgi:trans-aconitate methyltransferase